MRWVDVAGGHEGSCGHTADDPLTRIDRSGTVVVQVTMT
jgi:hypothetical protein